MSINIHYHRNQLDTNVTIWIMTAPFPLFTNKLETIMPVTDVQETYISLLV